MKQVTIVASDVAPVGGMERAAYEIARRLADRGWDLTVIARSCAVPGVRFIRLRAPARPISVAMFVSAVQGTVAVARHRRGLVHAHNPVLANRTDVLTLQFCERAYRALVGAPRNRKPTLAYRASAAFASWIDRTLEGVLLRRQARTVACVSGGIVAEVERFYPGSPAERLMIPNGVDRAHFAPDPEAGARTRAELGVPADAPVAMFIGGDWERKNLAAAIGAVALAPDWRLLVVGHGDRNRFAALAREQGAGDRVVFTGPQPDPRPFYAAADALLMTTGYEAFSLVSLEAAAMGLAIIAAPVNGTAELIEDGVNGVVVAAEPARIAAHLRALGADRGRLAAMGAAAREQSAQFDWDRIADDYEALLTRLAGS